MYYTQQAEDQKYACVVTPLPDSLLLWRNATHVISLLLTTRYTQTFSLWVLNVAVPYVRVQELCENRGGRPGLTVPVSLPVSVDVKQHWTMLTHWSQFVPNMSTNIRGHEALRHHHHALASNLPSHEHMRSSVTLNRSFLSTLSLYATQSVNIN